MDDLQKAIALQRNQHADDAAGMYADLMAEKRAHEKTKQELAKLKAEIEVKQYPKPGKGKKPPKKC